MQSNSIPDQTAAPLALDALRRGMGVSPVTMWRFRKRGWLQTINIAGKHYVTPEALAEFNTRAASGEFSRAIITPKKGQAR